MWEQEMLLSTYDKHPSWIRVSPEGRGRFKKARLKRDMFSKMSRTWVLAHALQKDYNVSTLLLEPVRKLDKGANFTTQLNLKLGKKDQVFNSTIPFIVQKTRSVPEPNQLWQETYDHKGRVGSLKVYADFLKTSVHNKESFSRNLFNNLAVLRQILQDQRYTCLNHDFQIIIDNEGITHYLDLDRYFEACRGFNPDFLNKLEENYKKALLAFNVSIHEVNIRSSSTTLLQQQ